MWILVLRDNFESKVVGLILILLCDCVNVFSPMLHIIFILLLVVIFLLVPNKLVQQVEIVFKNKIYFSNYNKISN